MSREIESFASGGVLSVLGVPGAVRPCPEPYLARVTRFGLAQPFSRRQFVWCARRVALKGRARMIGAT